MSKSTDYIVVDWVANKFYTLMENTKNVKLNDLVTCTINSTKDSGVVMFVGSEKDCKQLLLQLRKEQQEIIDKKSLPQKSESLRYDNENIIYTDDDEDDDLIIENNPSQQESYEESHILEASSKHKLVDDTVSSVPEVDEEIQRQEATTTTNKRRKLSKLGTRSSRRSKALLASVEGGANKLPCSQCECCQILNKHISSLNERLNQLESAINIPNEVFHWFDNIRSLQDTSKCGLTRDANELQNLLRKIPIDSAKLKQCTVPYSATATARNIIRALVPEKRLLAEMYLEDLEKVFGVESVNAIVDYCHLKFGEPKEIIKNSISNVMSKARQYLKSKSHEENNSSLELNTNIS